VALGEQRDELRLGAVRVLELVDEDVPVAGLERSRAAAESRSSWSASETWSPKSIAPCSRRSVVYRA
jgi:hypothetical protein